VKQAAALEWGHPLITPDGQEIRVPLFAFGTLRKLGLLQNNKNRLSPIVYNFLDPQYDSITEGLRYLLGADMQGPKWLVCHCEECKAKLGEIGNTRMPGQRHSGDYVPCDTDKIVRDVKSRRRIAA
jgi:hypothetical protein